MNERIKVSITGEVYTHLRDGENQEAAKGRLAQAIFSSELFANRDGGIRMHLDMGSPRIVNQAELERFCLQQLANICDRHKRSHLPQPTTSVCAECEQEQGKPSC